MHHSDSPPSPMAAAVAADLRATFVRLKRRLREQALSGDLPPSQMSLLLRLEQGAATTSALARLEGMRPQSMAAVVAALQAAGLVDSAPDPDDRRQTLLSLTSECRAWLQHGRAARQDWLSRAIATKLTADEQARLAEAIGLLRRLTDDG